jgi:hypothetical protein
MQKNHEHDKLEAEFNIKRQIKECWGMGIAYLDEPYHGGDCLVDAHGRILAWLRIFQRKELKDGLKFDIRRLTEVMPFLSASGRPLVLVVRSSKGLWYVMWKPKLTDFVPHRPSCDEQTLYDEYWDAVVPTRALKPLGQGLPAEIRANLNVGPRMQKRTRGRIWRGVLGNLVDGKGRLIPE